MKAICIKEHTAYFSNTHTKSLYDITSKIEIECGTILEFEYDGNYYITIGKITNVYNETEFKRYYLNNSEIRKRKLKNLENKFK